MSGLSFARVAVGALLLSACGEIERASILVRPRKDDYRTQIQPMFEKLGCSAGTICHSQPQGDLQLAVAPGAAGLEENYLQVKAKSDPDAPDSSPLLAALLPTRSSPKATHVTVCWKSKESCGYRKLKAWMAWSSAGDPRPEEIPCEVEVPTGTACDDPGALDVCCFRPL